ncbi:LOW QUALITY PROTEIN: tumor protein p53-inducible nuclear protein 1 [Centropristis striata]|uniref:LOW QUALITY PROTEIN: tumor protein p53-inducible nuclear protein 1 n=1 Tax=Centropristis striata TaxID=184440 RepID=UPI0027E08521|nr:LOW QUALITY PROTEIN: tumor protein p53-inducible nuclear protein 1 [Centropristis striata]
MTKVCATPPPRRRPEPRASSSSSPRPLPPQPQAPPTPRPAMFQRFASALFGDEVEELSRCSRPRDGKEEEEEEEEEDWILVNYLAEACSSQCGDGLSGSAAAPQEEEEEEEEEDLVMIPSPMASPPLRYASCTSLNSTADTDPDGGAEEEEEEEEEDTEEEEESGFLRLDACSLEESWFVTPPPCFTGGRGLQPVLLETSPLENLLIEHPSMSVYAHHSPPRLTLDPRPRSLDLELELELGLLPGSAAPSAGKEKGRRTLDGPRHRPEVAVVQRRSSLHSACYAAALSARAGLLQQRAGGGGAQRAQPLSRNALRRINLLRPPKASSTVHLHQPSQRHLNF